ncbi:MAG: glycosyltransferase family 2 protein [Candidatus Omnitrophica bacterium]|nr:glycosyltransferase family 2 protein [Candidatus Omnitrophota bacterium]
MKGVEPRCRLGLSHHLAVPPTAGLHDPQRQTLDIQQPPAGRPSQVVGIIIPARNEASALGRVLAEIPRALVHEIIVVDNGSTDGTVAVARQGGARVVDEPIPGYGRACLAGLSALNASVEVIVFLDGDHSDDAKELPMLLAPIDRGKADLVIGSRASQAEPGSLTLQQRLGNRFACWLMWRCFGVRYTDLGPFRAIRRDALARLAMQDRAFGWTAEMQAKAARVGLRIAEVPVSYRRRIGRSKISGTLTGTIRAGWAIVTTVLRVALQPRVPQQGAPCVDS